jgi:glutaredoxin
MTKNLLLLLGLALATNPAVAELYKWVGADGKITYSDTPPPADAKKVEKKRLNDRVAEGDGLGFATRDAMKKHPVVLFATDCGQPCDQARALLSKRGIPFTEKNPEKNLADGKELKKLTGAIEVPDLQVGKDTPIKGFNEVSWNAALDAAGYPKNAAPVKTNAAVESKDASSSPTKPKSKSEDIGKDATAKTGPSDSTGKQNTSTENKARDPNARSGPYHEPTLPDTAKNNRKPIATGPALTPEQKAAADH